MPSGSTGTPRPGLPQPADVDSTDPDAVGEAALTAMFTYDTRIDVTRHDATLRAIPYLTSDYAHQVKSTPPRSAPGAQWQTWTDHHAYTETELTAANDAGAPPDTASDAYRTWQVTLTPHGDADWTGEPVHSAAFVHLTRSSEKAGWKVAVVQIQ